MGSKYNTQNYFALSKDINIGGVRLISSVTPKYYNKGIVNKGFDSTALSNSDSSCHATYTRPPLSPRPMELETTRLDQSNSSLEDDVISTPNDVRSDIDMDVTMQMGEGSLKGVMQMGEGSPKGVTFVSTTQSEVDRARADLENKHINAKNIRSVQSLFGLGKGKKSPSTPKSKKSSSKKKTQKKSVNKKKSSTKKKSPTKNKNKSKTKSNKNKSKSKVNSKGKKKNK